MLKENLEKRLLDLDHAIANQDAQIQQMCANRNLLQGSRSEIKLLIDNFETMSMDSKAVGTEMSDDEFKEKTH